jgi:hypothetical protein
MLRLEFFGIQKFFTKNEKFTNIVVPNKISFTSKFTSTSNDIKDVLTLSLLNE